jgi:hypothetical protein
MREPPEHAHDAGAGHWWTFYVQRPGQLGIPAVLEGTRHVDEQDPSRELVTAGIVDYHRRPDTGEWCGGSVPFLATDGRPTWTVNSLDPLDLDPSLLCAPERGGCGDHGYYKAGHWRPV